MEDIRILLANDHPIVRSSLRLLLGRERGFRVIAEAANGREAMLLTDYQCPDVIVLDVQLPDVDGITIAKRIADKHTGVRIVFVTGLADSAYVTEGLKAGAHAYVLSDSAQTDLIPAVHAAAEGKIFLSPGIDYQAR